MPKGSNISEVIVSATVDKQNNAEMIQKKSLTNSVYTLQVGSAGEERLNILNGLYNPLSKAFLIKAGVSNREKILDVACGTGEMTCWLAQQTNGTVIGVDISEEQLEIARRNAKSQGITNVEFRKLSAFDLDKLPEQFDFIYCRFLLVHIQKPELVLSAMNRRLRENGIMACEEATASVSFCHPASPAFDKWLQLWATLRKANNTDLDLGLKLPQMFRDVSCTDVQAQLVQPVLSTREEKRILSLNTRETTNAAVKAKFATQSEMEKLVNELEELAGNAHFIGYVRNTQVWGRRKSGPTPYQVESKKENGVDTPVANAPQQESIRSKL